MSQLDQAKKEAKRLFNLAKANQENNSNSSELNKLTNYVFIENLSKAREILSLINGYKNWHEYEEVLKRKDFMFDKVDNANLNKENKKIYENQKYYIQDMDFNKIINPTINNTNLVVQKDHKNIILGRTKEKRLFETQEKKWVLNQYPILMTGSTGAGKSEALLSMLSQYVENSEGVIYMDGRGDNIIYSKIFSYAKQYNRLNDLYCLNFMTGNRDTFGETNNNEESLSHSIDPINPMLGNVEYFNTFFGRLGVIIHAILKELHQQSQLMDIKSLESILMLNNLITWNKEKKFNNSEIADYLVEIGLSLENNNDEEDFNDSLLKHAKEAQTAYEIIELFKNYSHIFKIDCSINMEKIFLERKMLTVLLPGLEKSTLVIANLGSLIVSQIKHIEEKYQNYNTHFQNIIIDGFTYFAKCLTTMNFNKTKNNYIFGCMDYYNNNDIFHYILNNSNTQVIMKFCDTDLHNKIKLDLINNIEDIPKLKIKVKGKNFMQNFVMNLNELSEGQAYVLSKNNEKNNENIINNELKYYCEYLNCEYIPAKREKKIWLVRQPKPIIYIKE